MLKSRVFLVIMAFSVLNMLGSLLSVDETYGTGNYPTTYLMIDAIRGSLYLFLGAIVMYYAGELVWRERDAHMAELFDASPVATWVAPVAKFVALSLVPLVVLALAVLIGVVVQATKGYAVFEFGQYALQLLVFDWLLFVVMGALALVLQAVLDNKYIGYFAFLVVLIGFSFGVDALGVSNNLFIFGSTPSITLTAFNQFAPFLPTATAYNVYWLLFALVLVCFTALWWVRGKGHTWRNRVSLAGARFDGSLRLYSTGLLVATIGLGGWIYYNTEVLNETRNDDAWEQLQVEYERRYKRFAERPMPTVIAADYDIDLYPSERRLSSTVRLSLANRSGRPVDSIFLVIPEGYSTSVKLANATLAIEDTAHQVLVYALRPAMQPGETRTLEATVRYAARGIENEVSNLDIVPNGTFVNSLALSPRIGYQPDGQIRDRDDREKYDLPEELRMPKRPDGPCGAPCNQNYIGNDGGWVKLSATVTTDADQIAIAPGSLTSETTDEATRRRTFRYELEPEVLNFFSVVSGRFEVRRERWLDVDLEVYFLPEHDFNVDKMFASMRKSLEHYSDTYGAYPLKQARIIEFPRYASFAQAFPGTMPYSESIGFIADLKDDKDIDMVTYVVAHEMAHQWWAHGVIGANVQGATMLSETFAQYSALRVQEQFYGRAEMRKFLGYEIDEYLRGRGSERLAERPLVLDEGQGYVHYRKGSVVMYALAEYIGRDSLDAALREFYQAYERQGPPYPTTHDFMRSLRTRVPDSLAYVVEDWLETITLYSNRVTSAVAKTGGDGKTEVTFTVEVAKFRADSLGLETEVPIRGDYIDVAVFGKPVDDEERGPALWRERVRFNAGGERSFTVTVDGEVKEVAVDPDYLLIDRIREDNYEGVE